MKTAQIAFVASFIAAHACAATLQDFGYEHRRINGNLAVGARPILIILMDFGNGTNTHPRQYYWEMVFNPFVGQRDLNGFFQENSNGRFQFDINRSAMIGPIQLTPAEQQQALANETVKGAHCISAAVRSGFDFSSYDANRDGTITQDELTILIVENFLDQNGRPYDSGAARWANPQGNGGQSFQPPGSSVAFRMQVCFVTQSVSFATLCHEVSHLLGTLDLYGVWAQESLSLAVTLMSATISSADNPAIYHLDPWHKMQLGWSSPRIYSLTAGGVATIPAAHMFDPSAPIILFDPVRGTGEFFMLEYRTRTSPNRLHYDTNVADTGLALWRVQQDVNHDPVLVPRVDAGTLPAQIGWRFCNKCKGLSFGGNPSPGPCPETGDHVATNSPGFPVVVDYQVVMNNATAPGQHGWRWCNKCQGMFYGPNQSSSRCPATGTHDGSASADYSFAHNDTTAPGQPSWRWCQKCQGMFYGPQQSASDCPAGGAHDGTLSGNYAVLLAGANQAVWHECTDGPSWIPPHFGRGSSRLWRSEEMTPNLRWLDGTQTQVRLFVRPFAPGDASITVEWLAEYDTWVDFYHFFFEFGTFAFPFNTLGEGLSAVSYGGNLYIKTGSTPETAHINKRMRIQAYGGPVTLGR